MSEYQALEDYVTNVIQYDFEQVKRLTESADERRRSNLSGGAGISAGDHVAGYRPAGWNTQAVERAVSEALRRRGVGQAIDWLTSDRAGWVLLLAASLIFATQLIWR